jgi:hypothetical protein
MLYEILDTLSSLRDVPSLALDRTALSPLEGFLRSFFPNYQSAPIGTNLIEHLKSIVSLEKERIKRWLDNERKADKPEFFLPIDFLKRLCSLLQANVGWLKDRPFYFFIDDYSLPRISKAIQRSLGNFILDRYPELFFKISTESATTIHTTDAHGKLLEETREYDMIDLGDYFLHAPAELRKGFLQEIVNQRLRNAMEKPPGFEDIAKILGPSPFNTYNELAKALREPKRRIQYYGWVMVGDLCSGDIAIILGLIRDMFSLSKSRIEADGLKAIPPNLQDQAIRDNANEFLNRVESAPDTGKRLRKIAEAFGDVARWYLLNLDSGNEGGNPPWQAFRIEVRSRPDLTAEPQKIYNDLIRYGVFLRDARGKSQRGAVVPRLYLRRLLIPSFKITPNQRDNIGLNPDEFVMLLQDPEQFAKHMKRKSHRPRADRRQMKLGT